MKKIALLFILVLTQTLFAQNVTKNPGDFTSVKVFDQISVQLIPGPESKVEIKGSRASEVEVINKNGELKLRMPFPKLLSGNDITIKLYFKQLESIGASEGSFVSSDYIFKQTSLDLNAKE